MPADDQQHFLLKINRSCRLKIEHLQVRLLFFSVQFKVQDVKSDINIFGFHQAKLLIKKSFASLF